MVQYHHDTPKPGADPVFGAAGPATDTAGRLAWVEDTSGEEHLSYDERGRVRWTVKRLKNPNGPPTAYRTGTTFDAADRLATLEYPDGTTAQTNYSRRGLPERVSAGQRAIVADVQYVPSGRPAFTKFGNGVTTRADYDERLRPMDVKTCAPDDAVLAHLGYDYDGASNVLKITDRRDAKAVPDGDPRRNTQTFNYDDAHRLTAVSYSFAVPGEQARNDGDVQFRYDRCGNLVSQTAPNVRRCTSGNWTTSAPPTGSRAPPPAASASTTRSAIRRPSTGSRSPRTPGTGSRA